MDKSVNGWPVLQETQCKRWIIPNAGRSVLLRPSDAGFVLTHFAYNFHTTIEPLTDGFWDEWGWSPRYISGSTLISNHWSGTALDLNAIAHPFGSANTFTKLNKLTRLKWLLSFKYDGMITWGGTWRTPDDMHFELNCTRQELDPLARELRQTAAGRKILDANRSTPL